MEEELKEENIDIRVVDKLTPEEEAQSKAELIKLGKNQLESIPKRMQKLTDQRDFLLAKQSFRNAEADFKEAEAKYYGEETNKIIKDIKKKLKQLKTDQEEIEKFLIKEDN